MVDAVVDKKGSDITLLDIREQTTFADYFLICNGENERQLQALADGLIEKAKKTTRILANSVEGEPRSGWLLIDFGDLVVHLFSPQKRDYYNLEELWDEGHIILHMQ